MLTSSTSEAYSLLFKLLCEPSGDEVLVPVPSYPLFEYLTRLDGIRATRVQMAGRRIVRAHTVKWSREVFAAKPCDSRGLLERDDRRERGCGRIERALEICRRVAVDQRQYGGQWLFTARLEAEMTGGVDARDLLGTPSATLALRLATQSTRDGAAVRIIGGTARSLTQLPWNPYGTRWGSFTRAT